MLWEKKLVFWYCLCMYLCGILWHTTDLGANYYLLPTYAPELNPAEKVYSYLRRWLQTYPIDYDLRLAIDECLSKITLNHMLGWYSHSGYL